MLIPCRPDTVYFHDYILGKAKEIRLIKGRLKYLDQDGNERSSSAFPSMIVVFDGGSEETKVIGYEK